MTSRLNNKTVKEKIKNAFNCCWKGELSMELERSYDEFLRGYEASLPISESGRIK